ncbi:MAG TPA: hypothetical protein VF068_09020 [Rubrobacter sp.]
MAKPREHTMRKGTGTIYRIEVCGELSRRYGAAFEGMEMETKGGRTILTGEVVDQPHLHGILDRISALGLKLVSLHSVPAEPQGCGQSETIGESERNRLKSLGS